MRDILRRCGAVLSTAAVLCLGAMPAESADGIARVDRDPVPGDTVRLSGGTDVETSLYHLRVDGATSLPAYCADISTSVDRTAAYTEASWETDPAGRGIDPGPVSWIVRNSYPRVDLDDLRADSRVTRLGKRQAIAGTQAAIWHYTNDIELGNALNLGDRRSAAVRALYDYLVAAADESGTAPPVPSVAVTPERIEGADPAEPLGPLTVRTTDDAPVAVSVKGARSARLTDGEGTAITEVADGGSFFVEVDPAVPEGIATVYARAESAVLATGGLFTGKDGVRTQPLITADSGRSARTASAKVDWSGDRGIEESAKAPSAPATPPPSDAESGPPAAPSPSPPPSPVPSSSPSGVVVADDRRPESELSLTGTWAGSLILGGAALLAVGATVMYLSRRNHRK
ncbi:thioester domain-containing protein [Nocardiopsis gilva]|nr:thioester domain-containing protein [Nocardiopsis gilva]